MDNPHLSELSAWNPHLERVTLTTLLALNQGWSIINTGKAGTGKTRSTVELLKQLDIEHTEVVGHQTPKDFYLALRDAKNLLVIDESAMLLRNHETLNLLLSALWDKRARWRADECPINYPIIFNTNKLPDTAFTEALLDRCFHNHVELTTQQLRDKIQSRRVYKPNINLLRTIKTHAENNHHSLNASEERWCYDALRKIPLKSVRDEAKLLAAARFSKNVLGNHTLAVKLISH